MLAQRSQSSSEPHLLEQGYRFSIVAIEVDATVDFIVEGTVEGLASRVGLYVDSVGLLAVVVSVFISTVKETPVDVSLCLVDRL